MKRCVLALAMCAFVAAPTMADLVQNGSFELGTYVPPNSFIALNAGDTTSITGWTVLGGATLYSVDYLDGYWQASDGSRSLDLQGSTNPPGGVSQNLNTVLGQVYRVTFDMAGNPGHHLGYGPGPDIMTMDVSVTGTPTPFSFSFDASSTTFASMGYVQQYFDFMATSAVTTLAFLSTTSTANNAGFGPVLDNVSVNAVPVPGAILLGLLGLGSAGLKLRRRA